MTLEELEKRVGELGNLVGCLRRDVDKLETIQPRNRLAKAWAWIKSATTTVWPTAKAAGPWVLVAVLLMQSAGTWKGCDWPQPNPPTPPVDPVPKDPFTASLVSAWSQEPTAEKPGLPKLKLLYRQASQTTVNDPKLGTYKQVMDAMKSARATVIGETLLHVREAINQECTSVFSGGQGKEIPLDLPINRDLAGKTFSRVADSLEVLK